MLFVGLEIQHVVIKLVLKSEDQEGPLVLHHRGAFMLHSCVIHVSFTDHEVINLNPSSTS